MSIKVTLFQFWKQKEAEWGRTITVTEVAESTGVSRDTLTRLRGGRTDRPSLDVTDELCKFFKVPSGPVPFLIYEKD